MLAVSYERCLPAWSTNTFLARDIYTTKCSVLILSAQSNFMKTILTFSRWQIVHAQWVQTKYIKSSDYTEPMKYIMGNKTIRARIWECNVGGKFATNSYFRSKHQSVIWTKNIKPLYCVKTTACSEPTYFSPSTTLISTHPPPPNN